MTDGRQRKAVMDAGSIAERVSSANGCVLGPSSQGRWIYQAALKCLLTDTFLTAASCWAAAGRGQEALPSRGRPSSGRLERCRRHV